MLLHFIAAFDLIAEAARNREVAVLLRLGRDAIELNTFHIDERFLIQFNNDSGLEVSAMKQMASLNINESSPIHLSLAISGARGQAG